MKYYTDQNVSPSLIYLVTHFNAYLTKNYNFSKPLILFLLDFAKSHYHDFY